MTFTTEPVPRDPPKSLAAARGLHVWGAGRMLLFRPGRWFYLDETHFQHTHVFGASVSTVTKVTCGIVTQVTMQGTLQEAFHCIRSSGGGTECSIALAAEQPEPSDTPVQLPFGKRGGF